MAASRTVPPTPVEGDFRDTTQENPTMDRILECAVAVNWKDLAKADEATSIQVEYRSASGLLEYVKLWSSTKRGFWDLRCEYWMQSSATHEIGATFSGGVSSADLAWMLDAIMQHQGAFSPSPSDFPDGLIQISAPSESFLNAAQKDMTEALDRIVSPVV